MKNGMDIMAQLSRLSIWRKVLTGLTTLMWIAFTAGLIANLAAPWYVLTPIICLLWIGYMVVVTLIIKLQIES
jgi:hypothetical protein